MSEKPHDEPTFGYLSTVRSAEHGYFGGYLIISAIGRPLEFHCTAPVRPSRAQEILYGPTLPPYLLGERIGGTLLAQAKLSPGIILTSEIATLPLRANSPMPMVYLSATGGLDRQGFPCGAECGRQVIAVAGHSIELPRGFDSDRDAVVSLLTRLSEHVDLAEPFERIHEAIREAQRIESSIQDSYVEAA